MEGNNQTNVIAEKSNPIPRGNVHCNGDKDKTKENPKGSDLYNGD